MPWTAWTLHSFSQYCSPSPAHLQPGSVTLWNHSAGVFTQKVLWSLFVVTCLRNLGFIYMGMVVRTVLSFTTVLHEHKPKSKQWSDIAQNSQSYPNQLRSIYLQQLIWEKTYYLQLCSVEVDISVTTSSVVFVIVVFVPNKHLWDLLHSIEVRYCAKISTTCETASSCRFKMDLYTVDTVSQ